MQGGLGFSAIRAGLVLLPFSLGAFIGVAVSAPLGLRLGKVVPFSGALAQAAGVAWLVAVVSSKGNDLSGRDAVLPMLVAGIGLGLLVVPLIDIALSTISTDDAGAASGTYSTFQQLGAALGIAVIGVVFFNTFGDAFTTVSLRHGFVAASWSATGGHALCAVSTLFLPDRSAVQEHARTQEAGLQGEAA